MAKRGTKNPAPLSAVSTREIHSELLRRERAHAIARRDQAQREIEGIDSQLNGLAHGRPVPPKNPSAAMVAVIHVVADAYGVTPDDLRSSSRSQTLVHARWICMYLARQSLGLTLKHIGRALGGRDHATVIHAVEQVEKRAAESAEFTATLAELAAQVALTTR